jgi:hypothetical protein
LSCKRVDGELEIEGEGEGEGGGREGEMEGERERERYNLPPRTMPYDKFRFLGPRMAGSSDKGRTGSGFTTFAL